MPLRAVTLDGAGTLFEVAEPVGVTYARVATRHGIAVDPSNVERAFRAAFTAAPPLAFPETSPREAAERAWWSAIVHQSLGPGDAAALAASATDLFEYYARPEAWHLFPDTIPALDVLRRNGLRLGVVSNFDGRLPGLLAALGLEPFVDTAVYSTLVGFAKPDPTIFRAALRALGVGASETLHAGDGVREDVLGARAARLRAVLVVRNRPAPPAIPDVPVVASLAELLPLAR